MVRLLVRHRRSSSGPGHRDSAFATVTPVIDMNPSPEKAAPFLTCALQMNTLVSLRSGLSALEIWRDYDCTHFRQL
jgi:hypothetical protein